MMNQPDSLCPLVYSCSGCSNVAQLANQVAIELDREQVAEMSCIAGVGGSVKPIVKKALSGRPIIALDGCPLHCVKQTLQHYHICPTYHYTLTEYGIKKRDHMNFDPEDVARVKTMINADMRNEIDQK